VIYAARITTVRVWKDHPQVLTPPHVVRPCLPAQNFISRITIICRNPKRVAKPSHNFRRQAGCVAGYVQDVCGMLYHSMM
jgi:hypothetical protein